ncbi:MAG: type II secretion system protein GspN [Bdellovibrionales bacterium]|jgi:type II secretion system protein N|nr:type II secretion system protein GspN [Bdellovibrionales bacterium]
MMKKKVSGENYELDPAIYKKSISTTKVLLLGFLFFILGFLANFPVKEKISHFLSQSLKGNPQCPIMFSSLDITNLIFRYDFKNPEILGRCFGNPYATLPLSDLSIGISRPSLVPLGLKVNSSVKHQNTNIMINGVLGFGEQVLNIEKSVLDLKTLSPLMQDFDISGIVNLNSHIVLDEGMPTKGNISLSSKDITVPTQSIKGFNINTITIGNLLLKVVIEKNNVLNIKQLIIGDADSPIISEISGTIQLSPSYMANSKLDLKGKLKVSPEFQRSMPILNLFLGGKKTDEKGFFSLAISGTLGGPRPSFQ